MERQPASGRTDALPAPGPSRRRKLAILAICSTSLFIVGVDVTAVNVALPSLERDLSAGVSGLQWTVDAYTVVMASLLMLGGSMADRFGRKRVFMTGLTVFTLASLLCSLAPSVGALVASRVLQAVGASMMNPVAMSIITNTFTEPRERAQAVGVWGAVFGISMAVGPVIGGALLEIGDWRAIFLINIPMGLAAILLTLRLRPRVAGAEAAAIRSRRSGRGDRTAGGPDLRDHRSAAPGLVLGADPVRPPRLRPRPS